MTQKLVRENDFARFYEREDGWFTAEMKGLSCSKVGRDLDKLDKEFTEYVSDLVHRLTKKKEVK